MTASPDLNGTSTLYRPHDIKGLEIIKILSSHHSAQTKTNTILLLVLCSPLKKAKNIGLPCQPFNEKSIFELKKVACVIIIQNVCCPCSITPPERTLTQGCVANKSNKARAVLTLIIGYWSTWCCNIHLSDWLYAYGKWHSDAVSSAPVGTVQIQVESRGIKLSFVSKRKISTAGR